MKYFLIFLLKLKTYGFVFYVFENHNSSITVNVFGYENLVYPLRISENNYKCESTVNALLIYLSKSLMYDFHYNYIKARYGDKAKLLFTDIDSLAYEITTKDFYKDINRYIEKRFDSSDYPSNNPSGIKTGLNSKVLGMFKDEAGGGQIVEFVGLRAKLYSYKMLDGSEDKNVGRGDKECYK